MSPNRRRPFALLYLGQACVWSTIFLAVFYGPFAIEEVTGSLVWGGLPFAMYAFSNVLIVPLAGRLMDRVGRPRVLALGHASGAAGALALAGSLAAARGGGAWAVMGFLAGLLLLSAGSSIALLTRVAIADLLPPESRVRGVGRVIEFSFVGSLLGALAFFLLARQGSATAALGYLAMVPPFFLGFAAMLALRKEFPRHAPPERASRVALLARPGVPWTVASNAGAQGGMTGVMALASVALAGGPYAGAILLSHFAGMFLPSRAAGVVADRRGRALAIALGGAALGAGALLFVRTDLPFVAGMGLFFVGVGWCFTFIPATAILADATTFDERGTLFGANDALAYLFGGVTTVLAGPLYALWSTVGLGLLGASCAVAPLLAGTALRRLPAPARPTSSS